MQSITDGTSNTGLFSERLSSQYPYGTACHRLSSGNQRLARGLHGELPALPSSVTPANMMNANPALLFVQGCNSISSCDGVTVSGRRRRGDDGRQSGLSCIDELHALDGPNTVPCINSADLIRRQSVWHVGPYGSASANSLHPGGVNVCFADGSVHFIKSSVSLQTWWALGTRAGGEVISSDQY